jgi:hypothetical protein
MKNNLEQRSIPLDSNKGFVKVAREWTLVVKGGVAEDDLQE